MTRGMKIIALTTIVLVMCVGCGKKDNSNKSDAGMQIDAEGRIIVKYEEALDKDYYDEKELESVVDAEVKEFNEEYGNDSLVKDSYKVKKDIATLWYSFENSDKYISYVTNYIRPEKKAKMFVGKYIDAQKAGIKFGGNFDKVGETGTVTKDEFEDTDNLMVVYTNEELSIYVPGKVVYYNENVTIDKDVVNTVASETNYILYKLED